MMEFLKVSAQWVNIAICTVSIGVGYFYVCGWLIGKLGRYIKGYWLIFDYALNYRQFKVWKKERRKACSEASTDTTGKYGAT